MLLLFKCVILVTLLRFLKAQDHDHKDTMNVTNNKNTILSTHWPEIVSQDNEIRKISVTTEEPGTTTLLPPIRCLKCAYCGKNEGKGTSNKGKKLCPLILGVVHGCISIFFNYPNTAGGPDGFLVRGCISELDDGSLKFCKKNENLCHRCFSSDCNDVDLTKDGLVTEGNEGKGSSNEGGARIMSSIFLVIASLIALL